jgi:pimeloyl-ACP methyl ester carboxylesterase
VIGGARAIVVGSSFGAVIALELARSRRELCSALVLIEPPMAPSDGPLDLVVAAAAAFGIDAPAGVRSPGAFLEEFDRRVARSGGPAAGEFYLRTVLGEAAFERMPRAFVERSTAKWAELRADSAAMLAYRPRYSELGAIDVPVLLLGGERSAPYFRATLSALAAALPRARLEIVARAGHMLHADAPQRFTELLVGLADELGPRHAVPP